MNVILSFYFSASLYFRSCSLITVSMYAGNGRQNAIRRRDTTDMLTTYINHQVNQRERRSSIVMKKSFDGEDIPVIYKRTRSNPTLSNSIAQRLERRRSAVTFVSTYKSLQSQPNKAAEGKRHCVSTSSIPNDSDRCYAATKNLQQKRKLQSESENTSPTAIDKRRLANRMRIEKSLVYEHFIAYFTVNLFFVRLQPKLFRVFNRNNKT